jgi:serine/threonine protein phosphatase PrpC
MKIKLMIFSLLAVSGLQGMIENNIIDFYSMKCQKERDNQDRYSAHKIAEGYFFAVYDGHGGSEIAEYLKNNLHALFNNSSGTVQERMQKSFTCADEIVKDLRGGSTASIVYVKDGYAHFAHVGDSRAVLLNRHGEDVFATKDHKPDRWDEEERIKCAGGKIACTNRTWRIDGLAISRSVGDHNRKKRGPGQIIAKPEYTKIELLNDDSDFILIASDGLWDVIDNRDIKNFFAQKTEKKPSVAQLLVQGAIDKNSKDDITVMIIPLKSLLLVH